MRAHMHPIALPRSQAWSAATLMLKYQQQSGSINNIIENLFLTRWEPSPSHRTAFECEAKAMKSKEIVGVFQSPASSFRIRRILWGRLREFLYTYMQSKLRHTLNTTTCPRIRLLASSYYFIGDSMNTCIGVRRTVGLRDTGSACRHNLAQRASCM